jgi:hypothetical protein
MTNELKGNRLWSPDLFWWPNNVLNHSYPASVDSLIPWSLRNDIFWWLFLRWHAPFFYWFGVQCGFPSSNCLIIWGMYGVHINLRLSTLSIQRNRWSSSWVHCELAIWFHGFADVSDRHTNIIDDKDSPDVLCCRRRDVSSVPYESHYSPLS